MVQGLAVVTPQQLAEQLQTHLAAKTTADQVVTLVLCEEGVEYFQGLPVLDHLHSAARAGTLASASVSPRQVVVWAELRHDAPGAAWVQAVLQCGRTVVTSFFIIERAQAAAKEALAACPGTVRHVFVQSSTLSELPERVSSLPLLTTLALRMCPALHRLPKSLGQLSVSLEILELSYLSILTCLPAALGQLARLTSLHVTTCPMLKCLPETLGDLSALVVLDVSMCSDLTMLPDSLCRLTTLRKLTARNCGDMTALPDQLGQLTALESLDLGRCAALRRLPDALGQLTALTSLYLNHCERLTRLPDSIGQLSLLALLDLSHSSRLAELPNTLGRLGNLGHLRLLSLPITALPDTLDHLCSLQCLALNGCQQLRCLPASVGSLHTLKELTLHGCVRLTTLPPSLAHLTNLEALDLRMTGVRVQLAWVDRLLSANAVLRRYRMRELRLVALGQRRLLARRYHLPPELWALVDAMIWQSQPERAM